MHNCLHARGTPTKISPLPVYVLTAYEENKSPVQTFEYENDQLVMHLHQYKDSIREIELSLKNDPHNPLIAGYSMKCLLMNPGIRRWQNKWDYR